MPMNDETKSLLGEMRDWIARTSPAEWLEAHGQAPKDPANARAEAVMDIQGRMMDAAGKDAVETSLGAFLEEVRWPRFEGGEPVMLGDVFAAWQGDFKAIGTLMSLKFTRGGGVVICTMDDGTQGRVYSCESGRRVFFSDKFFHVSPDEAARELEERLGRESGGGALLAIAKLARSDQPW